MTSLTNGMSRSLDDLVPDFREKVVATLAACEGQGILMRPYCTLRDPWSQARLYREGRILAELEGAIAMLKSSGAPFLAKVLIKLLEVDGPQAGTARIITNALPGYSWHQWGEAIDCYCDIGGRADWGAPSAYAVYAESARSQGLTAGHFWKMKDSVHIQLRKGGSARDVYSVPEIDDEMARRFTA